MSGGPIRLELTAGQAAEAPMAEKVLSDVKPRATLLADKAYDTHATRNFVKQRKCRANIPARANRKQTFSFTDGYTASAISWSVSSTASNRCAAKPHDMTDAQTTTWQHSSLLR